MISSDIQDLIHRQICYKYNTNSDISILDKEDVLVNYNGDNIGVSLSSPPIRGIQVRANILMSYIINYIQKYQPSPFKLILSLGDLSTQEYPIDIPILCLCKTKDSRGILIPNIDFFTMAMAHFLKITSEDSPYDSKINGSIFIGASTGPLENNNRIKYCQKYIHNLEHKAYINDMCQHTMSEWMNLYPFIPDIHINKNLSVEDQLKYKILVNIDGNTICWSRLYWQMSSNSIPVYINKQDTHIQFFDYLDDSGCYLTSDIERSNTLYGYIFAKDNQEYMQQVIDNGKRYCYKNFNDYLISPDKFLQDIINETLQLILKKIP